MYRIRLNDFVLFIRINDHFAAFTNGNLPHHLLDRDCEEISASREENTYFVAKIISISDKQIATVV